MSSLDGKRVLVIGRASGIARAVVESTLALGASVVVAGRDAHRLRDEYEGVNVSAETVDVTQEDSIKRLAQHLERIDHVVTTASARARGNVTDLSPELIALSFATKATGSILLAKHLAPIMPSDGSFVLSSGATALRPTVGMLAVAATNAAVDAVAKGLAVEIAPIRVNAIAPGVIDTGAYDGLGAGKQALFDARSACNPAGRIGTAKDVAQAVVFALTAEFVTGTSIPVDGGEILV